MTVKTVTRSSKSNTAHGSALMLTVILTSLLAVIGVLFVMMSRMNRLGANATLKSQEMDMAVRSVLAQINQQLVQDMPGNSRQAEYYDYPGSNDPWLASLEPNEDANGVTYWPQISQLVPDVVRNYHHVVLDSNNAYISGSSAQIAVGQLADADGDGVADSRWFIVPGVQNDRGNPVYAAVRIIDHGTMINVNIGYDFNSVRFDADARQMQIDLSYLSRRGDPNWTDEPNGFHALNKFRADGRSNIDSYLGGVVNTFGLPQFPYRPFDISDELKLRYRFVLDDLGAAGVTTRLEDLWSYYTYHGGPQTPIHTGSSNYYLSDWIELLNDKTTSDPNRRNYDYRHISTTYNADRLIDPNGNLQANINQDSAQTIFDRMVAATSPSSQDRRRLAQLAVNLRFFCHPEDANVATLSPGMGEARVYGFKPQPYISEVACRIDANDPAADPTQNKFYVELVNPFPVPVVTRGLALLVEYQEGNKDVNVIPLDSRVIPAGGRRVLSNSTDTVSGVNIDPCDVSPLLVLGHYRKVGPTYIADQWSKLYLIRQVDGNDVYLDRQTVDVTWLSHLAETPYVGQLIGAQRYEGAAGDVSQRFAVMTPLDIFTWPPGDPQQTLGQRNVTLPSGQTHKDWNLLWQGDYLMPTDPVTCPLRTVAELDRLLTIGPGTDPNKLMADRLANATQESDIRLDLQGADRDLLNLFQAVTVYDTSGLGRVKGRININTAPRFVLQCLPWLNVRLGEKADRKGVPLVDTCRLAQDIVNYRKTTPFRSIGDLLYIDDFAMLGRDQINNVRDVNADDTNDLSAFYQPDQTPDNVIDDFEEKMELFSLVTNQVTARSDVFSAYLLVRLGEGENAPQRRMLAILDRSGVTGPTGSVKILALQRVPSAR